MERISEPFNLTLFLHSTIFTVISLVLTRLLLSTTICFILDPQMLCFTSVLILQTLLLLLVFSSSPYAGVSLPVMGIGVGNQAPKYFKTSPSSCSMARYRQYSGVYPSIKSSPHTESRPQRQDELLRQDFLSPRLSARGNGICFYPNGGRPQPMKTNDVSEPFLLPAGKYALKWICSAPDAPTPS